MTKAILLGFTTLTASYFVFARHPAPTPQVAAPIVPTKRGRQSPSLKMPVSRTDKKPENPKSNLNKPTSSNLSACPGFKTPSEFMRIYTGEDWRTDEAKSFYRNPDESYTVWIQTRESETRGTISIERWASFTSGRDQVLASWVVDASRIDEQGEYLDSLPQGLADSIRNQSCARNEGRSSFRIVGQDPQNRFISSYASSGTSSFEGVLEINGKRMKILCEGDSSCQCSPEN